MLRTVIFLVALVAAVPAFAQPPDGPKVALDLVGGYAGFLDESLIDHGVVSATLRYQVTKGISVGPEIVYMIGPNDDRDLFLTGNMVFDFLKRPVGSRAGSVNPYLVVGAGVMRHMDRFRSGSFSSYEGAFTGGAGVRVWVTEHVSASGEYRVGWEPHVRVTGGVGVTW